MKIIKEELEEKYTFTKLFKEVEIANKINKSSGIEAEIYVSLEDEGTEQGRFTNYKEFKNFVLEEFNSAKELLNSTFSLDETFSVSWGYFGDSTNYKVSLYSKNTRW